MSLIIPRNSHDFGHDVGKPCQYRSDWAGLFSLRSPFTEETEPGFTEKMTIVGRSFAKRSFRSARSLDSMLDSFSLPLHPSI